MNGINPIVDNLVSGDLSKSTAEKKGDGKTFSETLRRAVSEVNQDQEDANLAVHQVLNREIGIHEGMMRIQEADLSLRLLLQVRTKVMDAYREIMRMQF